MTEIIKEPTLKELRQNEVEQYEKNVVTYQTILATLPTEWPDHLLEYRNAANQHDDIAKVDDLDDVALLSKLWYADQCRKSIRTEIVEMTKAKAILDTM
jgi:spore coat polysaccharide biosynthesis protein SpsF (cytidylyltransferase family)